MNYGILYFLQDSEHYAWIKHPAYEGSFISSFDEITDDVIWVSNKAMPQTKKINIVSDTHFFGMSYDSVLNICALPADSLSSKKTRTILSEVFERIVALFNLHYFNRSPYEVISLDEIKSDVKDRVLQLALNEIQQQYWIPLYDNNLDHTPHQYEFAPVSYIDTLLSFPLPKGVWRKIKSTFPRKYSEVGSTENETNRYLLDIASKVPFIAKISFRKPTNSSYANALNPLSLYQSREWFTAQEVLLYLNLGELCLKEIWVADEYFYLSEHSHWRTAQLKTVSVASASYRVMLSAHLNAMQKQVVIDEDSLMRSTPVGAWLSSWDRVLCLRAALSLIDAGCTITRFGSGSVDVLLPDSGVSGLTGTLNKYSLYRANNG